MEDSKSYSQFLTLLEQQDEIPGKLRVCLDFMKLSLSEEKTPVFHDFCQAKHLCLELFQNQIPQRVRASFWKEYLELSEEMEQLKEMFDEQASFSQKQLQLALQDLEKDLTSFEKKPPQMGAIAFPNRCKTLAEKRSFYLTNQNHLNLLNAFATRIQSLRRELITTQMSMRQKNQLFQTLSRTGDRLFPKRKELIQTLSQTFQKDVEQFLSQIDLAHCVFFPLKEEIKSLQSFAKILTLNSATFRETRKKLSLLWHEIKKREHHKSPSKEKETFQMEDQKLFFEKIKQELSQLKDYSPETLVEKYDSLLKEMNELCFEEPLKILLEIRLGFFKDRLQEIKWKELSSKGAKEKSNISTLLDERREAEASIRRLVKQQKKGAEGSNMSLEQSMLYQDLSKEAKKRCGAIKTLIKEIEQKIL